MSSKSSKKTTTNRTAEDKASQRDGLPDRVAVGRVLRPHGIRGEIVVQVLSDVPDRLDAGRSVWIARDGEAGRRVAIESSRPHKTGALLRFEGVDDRDAVEALRGAWLEVDRAEVPPAPEGTFYQYELLGCRCFDGAQGLGTDLGEVVDLLEDGGGLLLIVSDGERRVPIPFVQGFLRRIDVAERVIELDLPPGLIEECASRS